MKKLQVGLVIEGNSTSSTLLRLPGIAAELGPIKASGLQVARRVSNFLKGGYAVQSYSDFEGARTILIRVPDNAIERTVANICAAELAWQEHSFALCETWASTRMLEPLKVQGASIASVVELPSARNKTFAVEGELMAVRQVRRMLEKAGANTIELRLDTKHLLFAAAVLCTAVPIPLLLMAQQALRDGGVSGNQLAALIQEMSSEMLTGFLKGARVKWGGPMVHLAETGEQVYWDQLSNSHPELSDGLISLVEWSRNYMSSR